MDAGAACRPQTPLEESSLRTQAVVTNTHLNIHLDQFCVVGMLNECFPGLNMSGTVICCGENYATSSSTIHLNTSAGYTQIYTMNSIIVNNNTLGRSLIGLK